MTNLQNLTHSLNLIIQQTQANANILITIVAVLWTMYVLTVLSGYRLLILGIIPRHVIGLPGIIFAPLLHANFNHLFFNTIPLLVLANFILINGGLTYFYTATILITVMSGLAIWCFAKPGIHVGASAVVTGYWGLLVGNIYHQGELTTIILGIISLYYFAGLFFGIFPSEKGVSWEGHLFGLLAGILTGWLLS